MESNPKIIALVATIGVAVVVVFFWTLFSDQFRRTNVESSASVGEQEPIVIESLEDLPPGVPPPPPPPGFKKDQFHIPGTTDGIATPTPAS